MAERFKSNTFIMLLIFFTIVMIPQNQSILQKISNFFQSQTLFIYHWYMWCDLIKFSTDMYICNNCWTLCLCIYERLWTQTFPHSLILYTMTKKHEVTILFNVMPEIYEAFRCVCPRRESFAKCYWLRFFFQWYILIKIITQSQIRITWFDTWHPTKNIHVYL